MKLESAGRQAPWKLIMHSGVDATLDLAFGAAARRGDVMRITRSPKMRSFEKLGAVKPAM